MLKRDSSAGVDGSTTSEHQVMIESNSDGENARSRILITLFEFSMLKDRGCVIVGVGVVLWPQPTLIPPGSPDPCFGSFSGVQELYTSHSYPRPQKFCTPRAPPPGPGPSRTGLAPLNSGHSQIDWGTIKADREEGNGKRRRRGEDPAS